MPNDPALYQPKRSEWSRSGHFFLIALALHGALLFYPLKLAMDHPDAAPKTVLVRLKEAIALPPSTPAKPKPQAQPNQPTPVAQRTAPSPTPRPILAMAPEQVTAPSSFTVPAPPPAPAAPVAVASPAAPATTAASAPGITPARFDAAYLDNPKPHFPAASRRLGEEGKVHLRVRVSRDGLPLTVDLEKSSNFDRLDEAARQTVARWRFVPARRGDEPVEATVIVPIVFRLDN